MTDQEIWERTLSQLKLEISEAAFKTWFIKTKLLRNNETSFELNCPNSFTRTKLESVYRENILRILSEIVEKRIDLRISIAQETVKISQEENKDLGPLFKTLNKIEIKNNPPPTTIRTRNFSNLSPYYLLENFIVGSNNRLAFAMATAVTKSPGSATNNPFFLYAAVGLGKTHLVQAIGNEVVKNFPSMRILYTTSENFTNELIEAIKQRAQNHFRKKFRDVDLLIIDDIQFMAGRESTQEEFFNTFNDLFLSQKQIIITSDKHPREIARLEERLTSRFGGGITADIQSPDFDTRLAILEAKTESLNLELPLEILEYAAQTIQTNIRELEGGLKQIVNTLLSQGGRIALEDVKKILSGNHYSTMSRTVDPKAVLKNVCEYYQLREVDLLGKRRTQSLVVPRQVSMYLLRYLCQIPLMKVGEILGNRDHSTIIHGVRKVEGGIEAGGNLKQDIVNLRKRLEN